MLVVNAGAEDDIGQGIGDVHDESFADAIWIGIEEFLYLFTGLGAPVARNCLVLCKAKGMSDTRTPD